MATETRIAWRVEPRPWHHGYSDGEGFHDALRTVRLEAGYATTEALDEMMTEALPTNGGYGPYVPSVLLDALEFPALPLDIDTLATLAAFYGVSPGTLLDELALRSSGRQVDGSHDDETED